MALSRLYTFVHSLLLNKDTGISGFAGEGLMQLRERAMAMV